MRVEQLKAPIFIHKEGLGERPCVEWQESIDREKSILSDKLPSTQPHQSFPTASIQTYKSMGAILVETTTCVFV